MSTDDLNYKLLRQLTSDPEASQRGLATRYGVSVGKMNYCLRALVHKGLVKANNFRRSDNKLGYAYVLTPAGLEERAKLAKAFLQRKLLEFEQIQREIHELRIETRDADDSESNRVAVAQPPNASAPCDAAQASK